MGQMGEGSTARVSLPAQVSNMPYRPRANQTKVFSFTGHRASVFFSQPIAKRWVIEESRWQGETPKLYNHRTLAAVHINQSREPVPGLVYFEVLQGLLAVARFLHSNRRVHRYSQTVATEPTDDWASVIASIFSEYV